MITRSKAMSCFRLLKTGINNATLFLVVNDNEQLDYELEFSMR